MTHLFNARSPLRTGAAALLMGLLVLLALTGCQRMGPDAPETPAASGKDIASVAISAFNYRHDRAVQFYVSDPSRDPQQALGGEIVSPLFSGSAGCCLALPNVWHPGLKVRVKWTESDLKQVYPEAYERELEIPRYERPADLYVVFYPDHEVEAVVSLSEPGQPQWAGRIKDTPWNHCLATHGRKVCKGALPKLFDPNEQAGYCTYLKEDNPSMLEDNCAFATMECMRDYEDEDFCKKILWGPRRIGL